MTAQDREVPEHFQQALKPLQTIQGVKILGDWEWYPATQTWALRFQINIGSSEHPYVPSKTEWYVLISDRYPIGRIRVYPAYERGLNVTFQHQHFNRAEKDLPWTRGEICTDVPGFLLERLVPTKEPNGISERLSWHIERARGWVKAAAIDDLVRTNERFELPDFRIIMSEVKRFAYSEGEDSIARWEAIDKRAGLVRLSQVTNEKTQQIVPLAFLDLDGETLIEVQWGNYFQTGSEVLGGWVLLPEIPVIPPWQAPHSWGEIFDSVSALGVDLVKVLTRVFSRLRDGHDRLLLVGFPISEVIEQPPVQIHWQAISLPRLSTIQEVKRGFSSTPKGAMLFDLSTALRNNQEVRWLDSNNWNRLSLGSRGHMEVTRELNVVIIGLGAIGSAIAEMLIRGGLENIVLIDGDTVEAENLTRHTLTLNEEGMNKATAIASRLNSASPQASVSSIDINLNPRNSQCREAIEQADLVIDCTANYEVLAEIHEFSWKDTAILVSVSIGLYGKRVYIYSSLGWSFSFREFKRVLDPLIDEDYQAHPDFVLPHENVGCWHPVFPARSDDIWFLSSLAIKEIEKLLTARPDDTELRLIKYDGQIHREVILPNAG